MNALTNSVRAARANLAIDANSDDVPETNLIDLLPSGAFPALHRYRAIHPRGIAAALFLAFMTCAWYLNRDLLTSERKPAMSAKDLVEQPFIKEPVVALEQFGCFVALSQDRTAIFLRTMLNDEEADGRADLDPQTEWIEVTAPHPDFLLKVNELFGTDFTSDDFAER
jgi:hypothetical protein